MESTLRDFTWTNAQDHAKWAVCKDGNSWTCVGDMNRMDTQEKRGGSFFCVNDENLWQAFKSVVYQTEACPKEQ